MNEQKAKKIKIRLPIRAYLLYLLLASFLMTGVTFSKYITTSTGGDSGRAASIGELKITETCNFGAENTGGKWMIIPGVDLKKKAVVEFAGSEAATYVFVEVIVSNAWNVSTDRYDYSVNKGDRVLMSWSVDKLDTSTDGDTGWTCLTSEEVDEKTRYIYYQQLAPNTELTADILASNGIITVSSKITATEIKNLGDVTITLRASVVQSGGFSGALAAWTSIKDH